MTYRPRAACKQCGVSRATAGGVSRTGLCGDCGADRLADNLRQLAARNGPNWEKYRAGMTDYVAGLWGGTHIPDTIPLAYSQLSLMEVE